MEIHQTRRLSKRLQAMEKAGKNEREACKRAREIIGRLQHDPCDVAAENKRTRHGELRLESCRKYDLSCGFRLICLKRGSRLIFTWIGSHDDCQRWIENNRDHVEEIDSLPAPPGKGGPVPAPAEKSCLPSETDEYEEQLMARIDEPLLREIFPSFSLKKAENRESRQD